MPKTSWNWCQIEFPFVLNPMRFISPQFDTGYSSYCTLTMFSSRQKNGNLGGWLCFLRPLVGCHLASLEWSNFTVFWLVVWCPMSGIHMGQWWVATWPPNGWPKIRVMGGINPHRNRTRDLQAISSTTNHYGCTMVLNHMVHNPYLSYMHVPFGGRGQG